MKRYVLSVMALVVVLGIVQALLYSPLPPQNFIDTRQGIVAYERFGAGNKTIVLVHGSPGSRHDFDDLAPRLNATVFAIDSYGFGESDLWVDDYGVGSASDAVAELLKEEGISEAYVLGYSWGGAVAVDFATRYSEKAEGIILLASMGSPEGEPTGSYFLENLRYYVSYPFVVLYPGPLAFTLGKRHGFMRSFMDTDLASMEYKMKEVAVPALILHGDEDTVIPGWVAEMHSEMINGSEIVWYSGGHGKVFGDTEEIAGVVNSWI